MVTEPSSSTPERQGGSGRTVKSAERVLSILQILGDAPSPVSVSDLYAAAGYPRSSFNQILQILAGMKWIEFIGDGSVVGVGSRALGVGTSYLDRDGAFDHAVRRLEAIRDETGYATHVARLDGQNIVHLATREASGSERVTSRAGQQLPAHATALGKVLLAELSPTEVAAALPAEPLPGFTSYTRTELEALKRQLADVRKAGYAVEREEYTLGVACVAVAVPYRIPATDSLSCSIPAARADEAEIGRVSEVLTQHAKLLALTLRREGIR